MSMTLPYLEPLAPRVPGERQIPEPPRRGEPGGPPCRICTGKTTAPVWSDDNWTLHPPVGGSLPGSVWLASRVHVDSFSDLPEELAADFGRVAARVERAILGLGGVARVHLYRSEEHTSELQSHSDLVCRLLLEKKKNQGQVRPALDSA